MENGQTSSNSVEVTDDSMSTGDVKVPASGEFTNLSAEAYDGVEIVVDDGTMVPEEEPKKEPEKDERVDSGIDVARQISEGFDGITRVLEQQTQQNQVLQDVLQKQSTPKPKTREELMAEIAQAEERVNTNFYDNPAQGVKELFNLYAQADIVPAFKQLGQIVGDTSVMTSKQAALSNENNKLVYDAYTDEVEKTASVLRNQGVPSGEVYSRAIGQVGQAHFADMLEAQKEAIKAELKAEIQKPTHTPSGQPAGLGQNQAQPNKRVAITEAQMMLIHATGDTKGLDTRNNPDDRVAVYNWLKAKGRIK
jgi:hypothetical protein